MSDNKIQYCPLLSIGTGGIDMVCTQENCAWYMSSVKKCSIYMLGYNALMETNSKRKPNNQ